MSASARNAVEVSGQLGGDTVVLVHGFGVDQTAWSRVLPFFERHFRVLRYDLTGLGRSDLDAYHPARHASLHGHADDLREICQERGIREAIAVGHSAGGMVALLAGIAEPGLFKKQVLLSSSPRYVNEADYRGGFEQHEAEQVIHAIARDYIAWVNSVAPVAAGSDASTTEQVHSYFRRVDPEIAEHMFRTILFADHRDALPHTKIPTLVVQATRDAFVPPEVAKYISERIPGAQLQMLSGTGGHYPHLGAPTAVVTALQDFLL
ncbi:MAG TPA: alpha/beta hydrolase [Polyangiales bacterium]|nr:alpha/beta hydrolase [Polyangiales bacterium]